MVQLLAVDLRPVGRELEALLSRESRVGGTGPEEERHESALGGKGQAGSGARFGA